MSSGLCNKQRPDVPVSRGKQTGRKEAKESSKTCLYFACSGHRTRNNCLGECHNEYMRNSKESHVLRQRAISRDCLSLIEHCEVGVVCAADVGEMTSRESPAISALRVSHAGHESYFSRRTIREPFGPLPYCSVNGLWSHRWSMAISFFFCFCCFSLTDARSAQPSRRSSWEIPADARLLEPGPPRAISRSDGNLRNVFLSVEQHFVLLANI